MNPEDARRLAADPATDWATIHRLAQSHPEVHALLAENPATYPDLLAWLARRNDPAVAAALLRRAAAEQAAPPPAEPEPDEPRTATLPQARIVDHSDTRAIPAVSAPPPSAGPAPAPARVSIRGAGARPGHIPAAAPPPVSILPPSIHAAPGAEPGPPSTGRARRRNVAVLALTGLALVAILVWALGLRGGPGNTPAATSPAPTVSATAGLADALTQLAAVAEATTCRDAQADALAFATAGGVSAGATSEDTAAMRAAMDTVRTRCNTAYAAAVAKLATAQNPGLGELLGDAWAAPTSPAPDGATTAAAFSTPSGNINCALTADRVACTIAQYSLTPGSSCTAGEPVTVVVDEAGAREDCTVGQQGPGPALPYGSSVVFERFACTSAETGVRCWDTWTGRGFTVARAGTGFTEEEFGPGR